MSVDRGLVLVQWPEDYGAKNVTDNWNAALFNHNTGKPYASHCRTQELPW